MISFVKKMFVTEESYSVVLDKESADGLINLIKFFKYVLKNVGDVKTNPDVVSEIKTNPGVVSEPIFENLVDNLLNTLTPSTSNKKRDKMSLKDGLANILPT